jgi:hypothetical protein
MKAAIGLVLLFFAIISIVILGAYSYYLDYKYESEIGAYFENARDSITPEAILIQLRAGKQAMINEGLKDEDYGAIIFKKPDNSMKFQYQHLDGIIERAEAVQSWYETTYNPNSQVTTTENFKDVYNEKMDNLRNYIHADYVRSDWIAKDTWYIKNHLIYTLLSWIIGLISIIIGIIGLIILFSVSDF